MHIIIWLQCTAHANSDEHFFSGIFVHCDALWACLATCTGLYMVWAGLIIEGELSFPCNHLLWFGSFLSENSAPVTHKPHLLNWPRLKPGIVCLKS